MTLRTKLSLVLSILLVGSIGATGAILIYESQSHSRVELRAKHQLLAENRAFALRDNFEILENELDRLARRPQIDLADNNPLPEAQLLDSAHQNSVLYNTAVLLLGANGDCQFAVPTTSGYKSQNFGDRPWFQAARANPRGFQFFPTDEPLAGRTLKLVQPIEQHGRFAGALVGVIALGQDNLITPALRSGLPPQTDAILVDLNGRVVYPQDVIRPAPGTGWEKAIHAALLGSGTLRASAGGQDSLFAFAQVGAGTPYAVVFRWPWSSLTAPVKHQVWALVGILIFGIAMAAAVGLMLSSYLTRPIRTLATTAQKIGRGEYPEVTPSGRADELGTLEHAFAQMGEQVRRRVEARTRELERAQQALVEAERFAAMGKTSAAIAHELKNAMGGIGMAVDLILQDPGNQNRVARLRKQVVAEIARLRDVVDELLSFSRAPRIDATPQDLAAIVQKAVDVLADTITDRGATVEVEAPGPLPVLCDGHRVQGAVMNLVKNAVEAGRRVRVRASAHNGEALVEVADDGPGLSEAASQHLFEPFFTTKPNGTGLGLPTSRRFIEAHGGAIEATRAEDLGGALFRLRLPKGHP